MRMWKVPAKLLCRKHLLGEHVEHHMFVGTHKKNVGLFGYLSRGLLDPTYMSQRHAELVEEMTSRGYNHKSPIDEDICVDIAKRYHNHPSLVDTEANIQELIRRCPDCAERIKNNESQ